VVGRQQHCRSRIPNNVAITGDNIELWRIDSHILDINDHVGMQTSSTISRVQMHAGTGARAVDRADVT
jgi:hypothetical protein